MKTLISKGLLEEQFLREDRLLYDFKKQKKRSVLSDGQNKSLNEINNAFKDKAVVLFQGVTGSGKTEVYIELISQAVGIGKQVLYLLPEISLTPQIVKRLQMFLGMRLLYIILNFLLMNGRRFGIMSLKKALKQKL